MLEADGNDRRRQIAVVGDLLGDMFTHLSWDYSATGLSRVREQVESSLLRMTAQMPIRFTRILLGGERGPCESDFVSGAVVETEGVQATELYGKMSLRHPEITEWPALCTIYGGRSLDSALGTVDATGFDLSVIREAGEAYSSAEDRAGSGPGRWRLLFPF